MQKNGNTTAGAPAPGFVPPGPGEHTMMRRILALGWRSKALLPLAGVLLAGMAALLWTTLNFEAPQREKVLLVGASGALAICAVVLAVLAVLVERPLRELHEKIARVRQGDLNVTVEFAKRQDEIGELGRNFNEMARQLRESREEVQRLLASARTQMTRAEHLATLGELAAGLAHEIRNPLAGIAGVIEIIGRELPEPSPSREVLQDVQQEVLHIKKILSDLLDYARPKPPALRPADLNATVEHAVAIAKQQILSRPIAIELERAEGLAPVEHDSRQIQQVLLNLMLNAIQAIPKTGWVRVRVEAQQAFTVVRVADSGRGIAPEHLPNIFRPFFTTKGQGTGLGLSLARRIVEDHGGRIEVMSALGEGSTFSVWLPFRKPAPESPAS